MRITETNTLFFSQTLAYLDVYLPAQRGYSPMTIDSYRDALTVFKHFVEEELHETVFTFCFKDCTRDCVYRFLESLKHRGNSPGTRNQRLATLKSYLEFVSQTNISIVPIYIEAKRIHAVKNPEKEKEVLSEAALNAIFSEPKNDRIGIRNKTLMILLYDTATRISELLNIRLSDIHLKKEGSYIIVTGKGSKQRPLYLSEKTVNHLKYYMSLYHPDDTDSNQHLFYTTIRGMKGCMSVGNAERIIKQYAKAARKKCPEVPANVHPHMFRRTLATQLYQEGTSLALVSSLLGHSNIETTRCYAKPSEEMLRNAIRSIQPSTEHQMTKKWKDQKEDCKRFCGLR
ncbi:MAG: tyrosine-type recombinase/integrase [Sphaerochaetaceae bacterium]|nr:tyrosine-type recombinase/integrase [Clostridiaceae bacterium]